jgi:hypothetical protein
VSFGEGTGARKGVNIRLDIIMGLTGTRDKFWLRTALEDEWRRRK